MSNRFCLSSSVDNLNHGDCVIVTSPSDAVCFAEPGSLETLGWGYLLPRWSWKMSCWTTIPKCPDSPSVWIIACIGYFTFFSLWGFHFSLLFDVLLEGFAFMHSSVMWTILLHLTLPGYRCVSTCLGSWCGWIIQLGVETSWWKARLC